MKGDPLQERWERKIGSVGLRDSVGAVQLFDQVTKGFASPDDAAKAQSVFNDLIAHEAYDVFCEVFTLYNALRSAQARGRDEAPFKASLTLQLPAGWKPTGPADFIGALEMVQVERLEVVRPIEDESSATARIGNRLDFMARELGASARTLVAGQHVDKKYLGKKLREDIQLEKADVPVPDAVCEGIQTLLRRGTAELVVRGVLASPEGVADAIAKSRTLRSVELGEVSSSPVEITPAKWKTYETLMAGLAKCKTLESLTLCHGDLIKLHSALGDFEPGQSDLTSLRITGGQHGGLRFSDHLQADILEFMTKLAAFNHLKELSIDLHIWSSRDLQMCVLMPFTAHPSLNKLELLAPHCRISDAHLFPEVMQWSLSNPVLKHLKVEGRATSFDAGSAMLLIIGHPQDIDSRCTAAFREHLACHLEKLTVIGAPLMSQYMSAFGDMLAINTTLTDVDLRECLINIEAVLEAPTKLVNNATLRTYQLPVDPLKYYFENQDGIHGISRSLQLLADERIRDDPGALARAKANLDQIGADIAAAPMAAQAVLSEKLRHNVDVVLGLNVARVMALAAGTGETDFDDVGFRVMQYLTDAQSLRGAVHLSEASKGTDAHLLSGAGVTNDDVRAVVKAANVEAILRDPSKAPLEVNKVDANGANRAIREAAAKNDDKAVLKAKKNGALNFQGLGKRYATSQAVLVEIHPPVKTTDATIDIKNTSTATATTTATTSTMPTATTTATAVASDRKKDPKKH
ncbi:hypothetical protein [Hydrogenophaga sp.]|uniref:hypothetical protein n=1 Tax=Hydrogenophaga sp. TaxID=1904254 RepID=UPI002718A76F|nr:hypothetical protein [Hydrogenophaga sp.]MDO9434706.1 hypothetical protein [Hydrogenophaga sp.]